MQTAVHQERVIPTIVCPQQHLFEDTDHLIICERQNRQGLARQRKIARSRVRRNSRRQLTPCNTANVNNSTNVNSNNSCEPSSRRSSSSSSRSPSPVRTRIHSDDDGKAGENSEPAKGYKQYLELLQVPSANGQGNLEWSEPSGDDLSSEWDSDQSFKSLRIEDDLRGKSQLKVHQNQWFPMKILRVFGGFP